MNQIVLDRLIIRSFHENDWPELHEYLSDNEVVKYEPYDVYSKEQSKEEAIARANNKYFYAVCLKDSNKLIGNLYLRKDDFNTWVLGYVFNRKYHGYGYATESAKGLIDYAFTSLGARRIIAMCNPINESSWRLLERLQMRREGCQKKNIYFKNDEEGNPIWVDTYQYAILKDEWNL